MFLTGENPARHGWAARHGSRAIDQGRSLSQEQGDAGLSMLPYSCQETCQGDETASASTDRRDTLRHTHCGAHTAMHTSDKHTL